MFYLHKDHLGSITEITDQAGNLVQKFYYNAWGIRQTLVNTIGRTITDRGYTGHEHLPEFQLINMNGRVYDPMLGRFLSPDNYVQLPDYTQSFNRYAYAFNNPLKYTDPSGEFIPILVPIVVGAVVGGYIGGVVASDSYNPFSADYWNNGWKGVITGAFIGAGVGMYAGLTMGMTGGVIANGGIAMSKWFGIYLMQLTEPILI